MPELDPMKRRLTWTVYATPLMTVTIDLGLSIRVSTFEHVGWWLGPLPRSPGMGEGGDWWSWPMGVLAKGIPRGCQGLSTPVSLGYLLSVFNKTLLSKKVYIYIIMLILLPMVTSPLRECLKFQPGASGLLCYCTPPVCVPAAMGALAAWRQNKIQ